VSDPGLLCSTPDAAMCGHGRPWGLVDHRVIDGRSATVLVDRLSLMNKLLIYVEKRLNPMYSLNKCWNKLFSKTFVQLFLKNAGLTFLTNVIIFL
jgi:hypothetical protein